MKVWVIRGVRSRSMADGDTEKEYTFHSAHQTQEMAKVVKVLISANPFDKYEIAEEDVDPNFYEDNESDDEVVVYCCGNHKIVQKKDVDL